MKLTVLLPPLRRQSKALEKFNPNYEILVVDDGSIDGTSDVVKTYSKNNNKKVKIESYSPNKGKGFALKHGFGFFKWQVYFIFRLRILIYILHIWLIYMKL